MMKLNCKRIDLPYTPGEEIFTFPEESGLPFLFDVEEELRWWTFCGSNGLAAWWIAR